MYTLYIDCREGKMCDQLNELAIPFERIQLDIGDILIQSESETVLIIERKTVKDLSASIKDGRYHEQKRRLIDNFDSDSIVYLIEDHKSFACLSSMEQSALIHTMFRDKIRVIFSKNLKDSCVIVDSLMKRIEKNPQYFIDGGDHSESNSKANYFALNTAKKKKVDRKDIHESMLCQISGVSLQTAQALLTEFGDLQAVLNADEDQLKSTKANGRKISKTAIANILNV